MQPEPELPIIDGKYQLLRRIGEGGVGAVYEARHLRTGRRVAVKVLATASLSKRPDVVERFAREAMASGAIESQHIAHVTDAGIDPSSGSPYIAMDLLAGEDVERALRRIKQFPPDLALRVIAQACLGLQRAHDEAVVHRDIKPANLFLARRDRDGGELVVKILDFGIAKMKTEPLSSNDARDITGAGGMVGSPLYMSPEQALGRKTIDHRTDIWSLGVVLYEMLTGAAPHSYTETVGELLVAICHEPARHVQSLAPWVRPEVAAIVHRALALDPAARFASAKEMLEAIRDQLPNGQAIDETMVVPITAEVRAVHHPRFALATAMRVPAPSSHSVPLIEAEADESGAMRAATTVISRPPRGMDPSRVRTAAQMTIAAIAGAGIAIGAQLATMRGSDGPVGVSSVPTARGSASAFVAERSEPPQQVESTAAPAPPADTRDVPTVSVDSLPRIVPAPVAPRVETAPTTGGETHPSAATSATAGGSGGASGTVASSSAGVDAGGLSVDGF